MSIESQDNSSLRIVEWKNNKVVMIDQTKLPNELIFGNHVMVNAKSQTWQKFLLNKQDYKEIKLKKN